MANNTNCIEFEYEKGSQFRTVKATGVTCLGYTPTGLSIAFFTEHPPLPKAVIHDRLPDGSISPSPVRIEGTRNNVVIRETEFIVTMNLQATKEFINLLQEVVKQVEAQIPSATTQEVKQ